MSDTVRDDPAPSSERVGPTDAGAAGDPVEHLWNAAHEFLAAARAVIDAADAVVVEQQRRAATPRAPRLRRIDVQ
jgi:nucleotide-binding universal stress UspA family protein